MSRKPVTLDYGYGHVFETERSSVSIRERAADKTRRMIGEEVYSGQDFFEWAMRIPEPKTGRLSFTRFPMQRQLYEEGFEEREGVVQKGTQLGLSAWLVRWGLFWADTRGLTALLVHPKDKFAADFSNQRIKPLLLCDALRGRVPPEHINNVHLRQVWRGWFVVRGSQSKDALDAVDTDVLALDEYDTLTQSNIPDAERRVSGPMSKGLIRRIGVPSIPGYGISKLYEESDARKWMVKCSRCNEWQTPEFYANVDEESQSLVCAKCRKPLSPTAIANGEWVAQHPDREVRGYHMHRLLVPGIDVRRMIAASKQTTPYAIQVFHNKDRGEPFASKENRLSEDELRAAQREDVVMVPSYTGPELVTAGIDTASVRALNMRISLHLDDGRKKALWIGTVESFTEAAKLIERYDVKMTCVDYMPEHRFARALAAKFPGRIFLIKTGGSNLLKIIDIDTDSWVVTVRRTEALDATLEQIRQQRNILPMDWPEDYVAHLTALYRLPVETVEVEGGMKAGVLTPAEYVSTGPDDFAFAEMHDLVAGEVWWARQQVEEAQREVIQPLDDLLEFERTRVADPDAVYQPGFGSDYSAGFEE